MHPAIESLVPHIKPALLLDRVVDVYADGLITETTVREDNPYCVAGRVGAWLGIELIAQSAAALAGLESVRLGRPIRVGYLLGTRRYRSSVPWFSVGDHLRVDVSREYETPEGLGAARGKILSREGLPLADGIVVVYHPDNASLTPLP